MNFFAALVEESGFDRARANFYETLFTVGNGRLGTRGSLEEGHRGQLSGTFLGGVYDGHDVPVPHFGLILTIPQFDELADRLRTAGTEFVIEPYVRFEGQVGEQWTMFLLDPAGNALEFKAFADDSQVFAP